MIKPSSIRWAHRWLGLFFSLSVLMSAGSGVLHNIMSRTQPPPPPARPGGGLDPAQVTFSVAAAAARLPGEAGQKIAAVNLRGIGGEPWYQIYPAPSASTGKEGMAGGPFYVSAVDGRVDPGQDERYAAQIASTYLGGATVRKSGYLTRFDSEYLNIFRILPVYRFELGDSLQTRVYVSTTTGSVTRHTDRVRQLQADLFTNIHKFGFIPNKDARDLILTTTTGGVFLASLLGVVLFFLTRPRKRGV